MGQSHSRRNLIAMLPSRAAGNKESDIGIARSVAKGSGLSSLDMVFIFPQIINH
jgi:hypothetical protein